MCKSVAVLNLFSIFASYKAVFRLCRRLSKEGGRKVRAAEGIPLLKVEVIGNSECWQKKITAIARW